MSERSTRHKRRTHGGDVKSRSQRGRNWTTAPSNPTNWRPQAAVGYFFRPMVRRFRTPFNQSLWSFQSTFTIATWYVFASLKSYPEQAVGRQRREGQETEFKTQGSQRSCATTPNRASIGTPANHHCQHKYLWSTLANEPQWRGTLVHGASCAQEHPSRSWRL